MSNIAAMAVEEECVKHALLALAGAYVLDYLPSRSLLTRTNNHYQRAVSLISGILGTTELRTSERRDCIVSALSLLIVDDVCSPGHFLSQSVSNANAFRSVSTGSCGIAALPCLTGI